MDDEELDYELPITDTDEFKKEILSKVRNLDDDALWEIIKIFDFCEEGECWDSEPEKCWLQPIRKKIGLRECGLFQMRKRMDKYREKRAKKKLEKPSEKK